MASMRLVLSSGMIVLLVILSTVIHSSFALDTFQQKVVVNASELSIIPITPSLFKWDKKPGVINEIKYNAKIVNFPDLPEWLHYTYNPFTSVGYLYGVPPERLISINIDVVGWEQYETFDTRRLIISLDIMRKDPLEFVVEMKIDNVNVRDLCNTKRLNDLINVFSEQLNWIRNDGSSVLPVFMASAVDVGENRVPLRPNENEGVVIHFASDRDFSPELKKLHSEVSTLWKLRPCPRELKRTSMERHFRRHNLQVDWCSFRLDTSDIIRDPVKQREDSGDSGDSVDSRQKQDEPEHVSDFFFFTDKIPERSYRTEILLATVIPGGIGGLIAFIIMTLLWSDRDEDAPMLKSRNGDDYEYQEGKHNEGIIVMARDNAACTSHALDDEDHERALLSTPLPPQYGETHPNGAPALIYAV